MQNKRQTKKKIEEHPQTNCLFDMYKHNYKYSKGLGYTNSRVFFGVIDVGVKNSISGSGRKCGGLG